MRIVLSSRAPVCRLWSALVLLCGTATGASAQSGGTIRGRITDAEVPGPIANATITIVGTRMGTVSTNDGGYILRGVPAGSHSVRVTRLGFAPSTKLVTVVDAQEATADFQPSRSLLS
jgi:hypothetical protein